MGKVSRAVFVALALVLLGAGGVWAADTCYEDNFGNVLVGKNFKLPKAGACNLFNGYFSGQYFPAVGNVCHTTDPDVAIRFNLFSSNPTGVTAKVVAYTCHLDPTTLQGFCYDCQTPGACVFVSSFKKIICPVPRPFGT